jgi:glycosyltransferase involved in cell wall biosynthesis
MIVWMKERTDSLVLDACATTSDSFSAKLKLSGITCDHVIITAVDTTTFNKGKKNSAIRSEMTFGDTSANTFLCVYVGRISKEKRLDVIVEAVKRIPGTYRVRVRVLMI